MPGNRKRLRIGFVGTFEVANFGDCLFPVIYKRLLEDRIPNCEFLYYSPKSGMSPLGHYGPIKALPATLDDIQFDADTLIQCGGETLALGHSAGTYNFPSNTLSAFARMWFAPTVAASRGDLNFYVHSVGMPTTDLQPKTAISRGLAYASRVSLRDKVSAARLDDAFPVEVDPMFAMSTCLEPDEWRAKAERVLPAGYEPGRYLCAHISAPYLVYGLRPWCEQVLRAHERSELPILLLPICHFLWDRETLDAARSMLAEMGVPEAAIQFPKPGSEEVLATAALIGNSAGIMTSSLHALVSAVSFGIPFAGFGGEGKVDGKHRQTLAAAGTQHGVAAHMKELSDALAKSMSQDHSDARVVAIERALKGLDPLVADIEGHRDGRSQTPSPMPQDLIEEVLATDRQPTLNRAWEVKRQLLRFIKRLPIAEKALATRRRSRLLADAAG